MVATPERAARNRFLRACRGEAPERPPVWLMRQAGRYLPEYRELRAKVSFEELCRSPELACEVTLQPIRRYDFDAAIIFSDILVVSDALGCPIRFPKGGPIADEPVRDRAAIDRLSVPEAREALGYVMDALALTRRALPEDTALIGFCGGPLTVASYMVEGGGSRNFEKLKGLIYGDPEAFDSLMDKLTTLSIDYLRAQAEAGADALQVMDTWASALPKRAYQARVAPHVKRLFAGLADIEVPKLYFARGASHLLPLIPGLGATAAGIDWTLPLDEAREQLGGDGRFPVQGNLDPVILLGDEATMRREVRAVIDGVSDKRGYIFNLGHGVIKDTEPERVAQLVDEVRRAPAS